MSEWRCRPRDVDAFTRAPAFDAICWRGATLRLCVGERHAMPRVMSALFTRDV